MNTILTKALNYIVGIVTENEEVKKFPKDFVTASMQWVRTWFLVDDPKAEAKLNDPQRSEESKRTIIESKLEDLQDNPTFMKELAEHLAAFEAQKAKQKNVLSDTDVDVKGSIHIGDKGGAGSDGYDQKNIVKDSTIKAGGDFRLGDDIISGNEQVNITHNYYGKSKEDSPQSSTPHAELRVLLRQGQLAAVITQLLDLTEKTDKSAYDTALLLSGQYSHLQEKETRQLLDNTTATIERNRLSNALLSVINGLA